MKHFQLNSLRQKLVYVIIKKLFSCKDCCSQFSYSLLEAAIFLVERKGKRKRGRERKEKESVCECVTEMFV